MGRGIYLHPKAKVPREIDSQIACKKFGSGAVVGGLTALFYYNLTDQAPHQTWLLDTPEQRTSMKGYRLIRTITPLDLTVVKGDGFRIASVERAVLEAFKLATKIGERTAIKAARIAIQHKPTNLKKIDLTANQLDLDSYLTKYFEAIIGAIDRVDNG